MVLRAGPVMTRREWGKRPHPALLRTATLPFGGGIKKSEAREARAAYAFFFRKKLHQPPGLTSPSTSWQVFGAWK